jgi:hypothetical protein
MDQAGFEAIDKIDQGTLADDNKCNTEFSPVKFSSQNITGAGIDYCMASCPMAYMVLGQIYFSGHGFQYRYCMGV